MSEFLPFIDHAQGGRMAAALERIADVQEGKTALSVLEQQIAASFAIQRTGKVYGTRFYKYATNIVTTGTRLQASVDLTCDPSTDSTEGEDDFAEIPLFSWFRCNYKRDDADGFARPSALEGTPTFAKTGAVDVGTLHPAMYWKWEDHSTYFDVYVSDTPNAPLGLVPWCEQVKSDGTDMPYFIDSAFTSITASDGLLRSQPDGVPAYNQSYNNMITNYQKKGAGYWGAGYSRNLYGYLMLMIKYVVKSSQKIFVGHAFTYGLKAAVAYAETGTKRILIADNSAGFYAGACVSLGSANSDQGVSTAYDIVNRAKITSIENVTIDSTTYVALNLAVSATFDTATTQYVKFYPSLTGETDAVIGHHDGSYLSNTDGKHTFRIQGQEYMNGQYFIASDVVMSFQSDYSKDVYVYPRGTAHVADSISNAVKVGNIPNFGDGSDVWIGDMACDMSHGVMYPITSGSGDSVGVGDILYAGGKATSGFREYLCGGNLRNGSSAGLCSLDCWYGLGGASWAFASAD